MKTLLMCAALAVLATSAFAVGADLSVVACPGEGAANAATIDCAGGQVFVLLVTFMPAEDISDLISINPIFDVNVDGDLNSDAQFWSTRNVNGLLGSHDIPAAGCSSYVATWSALGSYEAFSRTDVSPSAVRFELIVGRQTPIAVQANQQLFGLQVTIDTGTAVESGGQPSFPGCPLPATFTLRSLTPTSASGTPTTTLASQSLFGTVVALNERATPTQRRTWGRLKSLYR